MSLERPWLQSYPNGVPAEIDVNEFHSVSAVFDASVAKFRDRPAYSSFGKVLTYGETDALVEQFAAYLLGELKLKKGDRVALMMPNCLQYPVATFGVLRAGLTVVNVNPLYTARELEHQLRDSGATTIVILENFAATLAEVIERTPVKKVVVASMGDLLGFWYGQWITFAVRHLAKLVPAYKLPLSEGRTVTTFNRAIAEGSRLALKPAQSTLDSIAFLQYTGGTTGLSKGAVLTHRNIVAAILQAEAWFTPALERVGDVSKTNNIAALPLYHIFALTLCLLTIRWGAHLTLIPNPRDFGKFIEVLKRRPFHMLPAVNTLFNALLQHPQFKTVDFSSLCVSQAGGMAASEGTAKH